MPKYADIVFPTAVRSVFTYEIPSELKKEARPGVRAWVPLRNYTAIGVIVNTHNTIPEFKTRPIRKVLDEDLLLTKELMDLTEWIHKFYFCSWGEVIQAALPAGLNFVSRKNLRINEALKTKIKSDQKEVLDTIRDEQLDLDGAKRRWKGTPHNKIFELLIKNEGIEIWEEPDLKVTVKTEKEWNWSDRRSAADARTFLEELDVKHNKWQSALQKLTETDLPIRHSEISKLKELSDYAIRKLQSEGWIEAKDVEVQTDSLDLDYDPKELKSLNQDQSEAFQSIKKSIDTNQFENYLLYGITGSGKTEVYIHALKTALERGKGGIVLVPEIALTPQTVSRFYKIFGDEIAVLHSRMTNRERLRAWKDLKSGSKKIAIGPRSAIFAPVKDLGLIILDEEHDASYKQIDPAPRYHARETAIMRANLNNAVVIMGSATPSMQALHMAARGKCRLIELNKRHADAMLPEVQIIDLKQYRSAMRGELAIPLFTAIRNALEKDEQVILLYNRRGFASYIQCEACGHIPQSPECSVSLTYHKRKNILMCHYSGYSRKADTKCEICGSNDLKIQGSGTQKIEEELAELFEGANILRFDKDSTSRKGAHEKILNKFGDGEADILIGTQLVAKGLDFPNVTVVGVIDADTEQAFPSFQSTERMYQLLSQVSGRSGRGSKPGTVFIQTMQADNPAIQFAKEHDHKGFSKEEMGFRKPLNYPPYSRLITFVLKGKKEHQVSASAHIMRNTLERILPEAEILGPSSAAIGWMNKNFYWELTLKIDPEKGANYIEALLTKVMEVYENENSVSTSVVRVNINVDAIR